MSVVNPEIVEMISLATKSEMSSHFDVYGNPFISDLRPSAGGSAQKSGALFEAVTCDVMNKCNINKKYEITKKPKFKCHFGLPREGDFQIQSSERQIHIECKQLGDAQSHFDKLSHCLMNVVSSCYGNHFWLVYDYNREIGNKSKIEALVSRTEKLKQQVALQGITFETILIDDLPLYLNKI